MDVADRIAGGFEVIQITSFTGSLTSRRKSDIEKSFDAALAGGELNGPIVSRQLLLPMDQSKEAAVCRAGEDRCFEMLWATMIRLIPDLPGRKIDMVLGKRLQPNHGDG